MTRIPAAVFALTALAPAVAAAADWHYCLAVAHERPVVYMTEPFSTTAETSTVEMEFAATLKGARYSYDDVQCPRAADRASVLDLQQYAMTYNLKVGNRVINVRWTPPR